MRTPSSLVSSSEGPAKKIDGPPRTFAKSETHPPTIRVFFLDFFKSTFLGVSRQGEFKNTTKTFLQKVHVKSFSEKNRQNFRCQFFLDFFLFYRVFGCFSAMGAQKHYQKRFAKKIVSKSFYKKFDHKSRTDNFSVFFIMFLGVSL
jgi:hypothetical protein